MDSPVTVTTIWKKNRTLLTTSESRELLDAVANDDSTIYVAQAVFSPVQQRTDDGVYDCEVSISAVSGDFIVDTEPTKSSNITIQAGGMFERI